MSPATRQLVTRLHLWLGLPAAGVYLVVALTGALLVYEKDLDRAWHPELWRLDASAPALPLDILLPLAQAAAPGYELKEVRLTAGSGQPAEFRFDRGPHVRLDPATGALLGTRARSDSFFGLVERLHTNLVLGPVGKWIVTTSTVVLLALLGTGLVLWWPKQWRQLKGAVSLALGRKGRAFHFNLHNTLGFWAALPLFALALTGSVMAIKPIGAALQGGAREMRPPTPLSDPALPAAPLAAIAANAAESFPGWQQLRLHAPRPMHEMNTKPAEHETARSKIENPKSKMPAEGGVWRVEAVTAGTPHEHARSRAWLDPRTATAIRIDRFADLPLGARLRALARPLHDGSILGRPTQFIVFLGVLMLPVLSVTGAALWWLKRRAQRARTQCVTHGLVRPAPGRGAHPPFPLRTTS